MLAKITDGLAQTYYENSGAEYDEDDIEVYSYGLQMFLAPILDVLVVLVLGLCLSRFFETAIYLGAFITLRSGAGGYHAKTYFRCFLGLVVVYGLHLAVLAFVPAELIYFVSLGILLVSVFPILRYAPVADPNRPIGPIQRKTFRMRSLVVLVIQTAIILTVCGMGLLWVSIPEKIQCILLSLTLGLLTASGSLIAAKIQNARGCGDYDCQDSHE